MFFILVRDYHLARYKYYIEIFFSSGVFLLLLFVLFWSFIIYCLTFSITPVLHEINNVIVLLVTGTGTVTTESIPFNSCHILFLPQMDFCFFCCYFMHSFGTLALSLLFSMWFDLLKFDIDVVLRSELCRYVDANTHTYSFTPGMEFQIWKEFAVLLIEMNAQRHQNGCTVAKMSRQSVLI